LPKIWFVYLNQYVIRLLLTSLQFDALSEGDPLELSSSYLV